MHYYVSCFLRCTIVTTYCFRPKVQLCHGTKKLKQFFLLSFLDNCKGAFKKRKEGLGPRRNYSSFLVPFSTIESEF